MASLTPDAEVSSVKEPENLKPVDKESIEAPFNEGVVQSVHGGFTESSVNKAEASNIASVGNEKRDKSLETASELLVKGSIAINDLDFIEATECFSRALEIRAAHYGELSLECVDAYHKYGCALLSKAQKEADPLVMTPKKDDNPQQDVESGESSVNYESTTTLPSSITEQNHQEGTSEDGPCAKDHASDADESGEDVGEAEEEDESDLDLAWKMLDIARVIMDKNSCETLKTVDILSSLAEVSLEREDIETSLSDYFKALSLLEHIVEPHSRRLAELNFRICLCLEVAYRVQEAIPYCEKAISICKSGASHLPTDSNTEVEIKTLNDLCTELEKKLEDLHQAASNPRPSLAEMAAILCEKEKKVAANGFSAANGSSGGAVMNLGVVGRGVKRAMPIPIDEESDSKKSRVPFGSEGGRNGV